MMNGISKITLTLFILSLSCAAGAQESESYEYERASLHVMMIKHLNQRYDDVIEDVFNDMPFPERFNNHNLGVKVVSFAEVGGDQQGNIESFIEQVGLGQKMVAKWFNRKKESGGMDMQLIRERGFYNASQADINKARASIRGAALLEDAGEELIAKTYLLVNDISYTSKAGHTNLLKFVGSVYAMQSAEGILNEIGGFRVNVTSYLFSLEWNQELANKFYNDFYTENGNEDSKKVRAFKASKDLWRMKFVGKSESVSSETKLGKSKDAKQLLVKISTRALDNNIAQLQKQYPEFRIKAPIVGVEPIRAYVGLKEGITANTRFEVLERCINETGGTEYRRVAIIEPVKELIWDNRFMALDEDHNSGIDGTTFKKISGGEIFPGMLIREL